MGERGVRGGVACRRAHGARLAPPLPQPPAGGWRGGVPAAAWVAGSRGLGGAGVGLPPPPPPHPPPAPSSTRSASSGKRAPMTARLVARVAAATSKSGGGGVSGRRAGRSET